MQKCVSVVWVTNLISHKPVIIRKNTNYLFIHLTI